MPENKIAMAVTYVPGERGTANVRHLERSYQPGRAMRDGHLTRFILMGDPERNGCWWNVRRSWYRLLGDHGGADWLWVSADDGEGCADFWNVLSTALAAVPDANVVNLMTGRPKLVERAGELHTAWMTSATVAWGGMTMMRRDAAHRFIRWADRACKALGLEDQKGGDDGLVRAWSAATGERVWQTFPSLADHAGHATSEMGHMGAIKGRYAVDFAGTDVAHLDADWWKRGASDPPAGTENIGKYERRIIEWAKTV